MTQSDDDRRREADAQCKRAMLDGMAYSGRSTPRSWTWLDLEAQRRETDRLARAGFLLSLQRDGQGR